MKTLLRKLATTAAFVMVLATPALQGQAQDKWVYHKALNSTIGITVENAAGGSYVIKDQNGNIALEGKIKSDKTFYIPTSKFAPGTYRFCMGSLSLQEFEIR